ncbi:hypothetical protein PanWU01x14_148120 [Parasponia andersonii]|uniref:Uncharacterized protein n=1 Tax=Parasponia andersonii TaxID=3476 RepID=A0A2P5CIZ8_PARAD|nr:hypothetical protein PanWU01x14_148120 [Parasponia andersonii]
MAPHSLLIAWPLITRAISIKLPLPISYSNLFPFSNYMLQIHISNNVSVPFMEAQLVKAPLLFWVVRHRHCPRRRDRFGQDPPDFCPHELVRDSLELVHTQDEVSTVFSHLGLEPLGAFAGVGAQVGFNGGVGLAPLEAVAGELVEGDSDVRVEVAHEAMGVLLEKPADFVRTVLADDCPDEHEAGYGGTHCGPHLRHCHRSHFWRFKGFLVSGFGFFFASSDF